MSKRLRKGIWQHIAYRMNSIFFLWWPNEVKKKFNSIHNWNHKCCLHVCMWHSLVTVGSTEVVFLMTYVCVICGWFFVYFCLFWTCKPVSPLESLAIQLHFYFNSTSFFFCFFKIQYVFAKDLLLVRLFLKYLFFSFSFYFLS